MVRNYTYPHFQIEFMVDTALSCLFTFSRATFEYDLTEPCPPAQVHEVDQEAVLLCKSLKVVHCDPEEAAPAPQLLW